MEVYDREKRASKAGIHSRVGTGLARVGF